QQLDSPQPNFCCAIPVDAAAAAELSDPNLLSQRAHTNAYGFAMVGTRIPGTMLSVGASAYWGGLPSMDGVEQVYAMSQRVDQNGYVGDFRLGLTGELGRGRTFEALVLHNRFNMTHTVSYIDWLLDPLTNVWSPRNRVDVNFDQTNTWGL